MSGWPGKPTQYVAAFDAQFVLPDIIAKVIAGEKPDKAIEWAEASCPAAVKVKRSLLVSQVPDSIKAQMLEHPDDAEQIGFGVVPPLLCAVQFPVAVRSVPAVKLKFSSNNRAAEASVPRETSNKPNALVITTTDFRKDELDVFTGTSR